VAGDRAVGGGVGGDTKCRAGASDEGAGEADAEHTEVTMANETKKTKVDDPRATRLLFDALKQKARGQTALVKLTPADAVALTGMPSAQAEPALKSLVKTYRSHLAVTDDGDLVYEFDPALERRDNVPLGERLQAAGQVA